MISRNPKRLFPTFPSTVIFSSRLSWGWKCCKQEKISVQKFQLHIVLSDILPSLGAIKGQKDILANFETTYCRLFAWITKLIPSGQTKPQQDYISYKENNKLLILSMKISLSWTLFRLAQVYSWNQTADKLVILQQTKKKFEINCS